MTQDYVILVDENDNEIGVMEKLQAHQEGKLHRAFSIFIFNEKNQLLIQQRALAKYHSAGLWANTCCSHPRPNETIKDSANRRLFEEMGMSCDLQIKTNFIYKTQFENGLIENELDYVLVGYSNQNPIINREEVESYKWQYISDIKIDVQNNPQNYASWFKIALDKVF
jgi:isopentenyl-diphosphate delta-isomerase